MTGEKSILNIPLACENVTRDILGLCAGDVNGTYLPPNGYKIAVPNLELVNRGILPITQEITFPVRAEHNMEIGAITLLLDFDPSLIEITGVTMPDPANEQPWYFVTGNTLNIGWVSLKPINLSGGETMLVVHTRMTNAELGMTNDELQMTNEGLNIGFALNDSQLSELADGDGNVIDNVKLAMPEAGASGTTVRWQSGKVVCYPNPARSTLNLELETPLDVPLNLEFVNIQGVSVLNRSMGIVKAGWYKEQLDLRGLAPGVYFLKVNANGDIIIRKVIITR